MARRASPALVRTPFPRPALARSLGGWRRTLGLALAAAALAAAAYAGARETSAFAFRSIELAGADGAAAKQVRKALRPLEGESLVALDPGEVEALLRTVPTVRDASVDRAFPHTLAVRVEPERPLAVIRDGKRAWLVAETGRVLATLEPDARPRLPRIRAVVQPAPAVGGTLAGAGVADTLGLLASVPRSFPGRVLYAERSESGLVLVLTSRLEVRLGEATDLESKLAAAAAVLRAVSADELAGLDYVDASVPVRVVAGADPQPSSDSLELAGEVPAN